MTPTTRDEPPHLTRQRVARQMADAVAYLARVATSAGLMRVAVQLTEARAELQDITDRQAANRGNPQPEEAQRRDRDLA